MNEILILADGSCILKSPAKLNLYLKVLGKRPDGYHSIETVFERIDLCDEIKLRSLKKDIVISCDNPAVPVDSRNLVYKAAQILKERYSISSGVEIILKKRIPVAAGLGGASSNCASCLMGLNRLWDLKLDENEIFQIGSGIGADVAFFLLDAGRALGRGKGEMLEPLHRGEVFWYLLVNPGFEVLAKDAYFGLNLGLTHLDNSSKINIHSLERVKYEDISRFLFNSLERPVEEKFKEISMMKSEIKNAGLSLTLMSGSGPTVYGIASSKEELLKAMNRLSLREGWQAFVAATQW
ncbi:MAG: 4-(cytidine 5'-diphospho)-2-C-methyl-D-erythritol kinase [Candidatus Omnitrophota bacterium]